MFCILSVVVAFDSMCLSEFLKLPTKAQFYFMEIILQYIWLEEQKWKQNLNDIMTSYSCLIFLRRFFEFRFTMKLRGNYRDFSFISCSHACITSPITITHKNGTFHTKDDSCCF